MNKEKKNQANILARECMVTALMQLLKEKPLSAISVSELTKKAGVSRMTYYRNYQTKEDIFASYLEDILIDYQKEALLLPLDTQCYESVHLLHCFSYFEKHKDFLNSLLKSGRGDLLLDSISKYVLKMWHTPEDGIQHYYGLQAFAGALFNLYITWASNGTKETPEELTKILEEIIHSIRRHSPEVNV